MSGMTGLLIKVLSLAFYRSHVMLFLLVLGFAGGFMRSSDHVALAEYFVSVNVLLLIPMLVWIVYLILMTAFNRAASSREESIFLRNYLLFPASWQWIASLGVVAAQLAPVYAYAMFLCLIAIKTGMLPSFVLLITAVLTITLIAAWSLRRFLRYPAYQKDIPFIWRWIGKSITRPFVLFPIEWAFRRQILSLAGYKMAGVALLRAALFLYKTDTYDIRLAGIGVVFSFSLNITFIFLCHHFLHSEFTLYRQQPISLLQRFGYTALMILIISIPETILIVRHLPVTFGLHQALMLVAMGISLDLLFYHYLYLPGRTPEKSMPFVYTVTIVSFLLILGGIPSLALATIYTTASILLYRKYHYRFESHAK